MITNSISNYVSSKFVRNKSHIFSDIKESKEKRQYLPVKERRSRPCVVDFSANNPRISLDLTSAGSPKLAGSLGNGNGIDNNKSNSSSSRVRKTAPLTGSFSPSSSSTCENRINTSRSVASELISQQSKTLNAYNRQKIKSARKTSLGARFSLSLTLHSIQEESQNGGFSNPSTPKTNFAPSNSSNIPFKRGALSSSRIGIIQEEGISSIRPLSISSQNASTRNSTFLQFNSQIQQQQEDNNGTAAVAVQLHGENPNNLMPLKFLPHLASPQSLMLKSVVNDKGEKNV